MARNARRNDEGNVPREGKSRPDPGQDQSGATKLDDSSAEIIAHSKECAKQLDELAEMLAALARVREGALLVRAALIYKGIALSTATRLADFLGDEGEARDE
jgi:hypothetical protein